MTPGWTNEEWHRKREGRAQRRSDFFNKETSRASPPFLPPLSVLSFPRSLCLARTSEPALFRVQRAPPPRLQIFCPWKKYYPRSASLISIVEWRRVTFLLLYVHISTYHKRIDSAVSTRVEVLLFSANKHDLIWWSESERDKEQPTKRAQGVSFLPPIDCSMKNNSAFGCPPKRGSFLSALKSRLQLALACFPFATCMMGHGC